MNGFWAILLKEFSHIRRDRLTIFFTFLVPALQLTIFGYAINVTIGNIPLVVLDLDGRQESRRLIEAMCSTRTFVVAERVQDADSFRRSLNAGRAKVGVLIPATYSEHLLRGEQAQVQVLIDGSDSQVASTALNAVNLLGMQLSAGRARAVAEAQQTGAALNERGEISIPIEIRPRLLYNPNLESSHFFVPGLIAVILQLVLLFLTSFSIVREREQGTLEQLFVTPVGRAGLLFGKLIPYTLMGFGELLIVLVMMVAVFRVPIHGSLGLLVSLSAIFIVTVLGLGLLISTLAGTQLEAIQIAFIVMLPSVLLSGFMFPRSEMPYPIYLISCLLPVTYFIEILRGVILRDADLIDLMPHILRLTACGAVILILSLTRFRKQID
jgi:ABC-type multidrug transport system permease subunit